MILADYEALMAYLLLELRPERPDKVLSKLSRHRPNPGGGFFAFSEDDKKKPQRPGGPLLGRKLRAEFSSGR